MTALQEYQRLECTGLWRESPDAQRRDVVVSFGDASLIIRELPSERALSHWSLPATRRLNPGRMPALFSPGPASTEEVEIDDEAMIAAIAKVHTLIERRRPRPGRLRGAILWWFAAAVFAALVFWLPGALISHTARVLPSATRADLGQAILADLQRIGGNPCASPEGSAVLEKLGARLLGPSGRLVVIPEGLEGALYLPGRTVAIGRRLLEDHETPAVVAGHVLAERIRAEMHDPVPGALRHAGLHAALRVLTTGEVQADALRGYAEVLIAAEPSPVPADRLIARFKAAGVASTPYARALDRSGESTLALIEADPYAATPPPEPLLDDTVWVALQGICSG